MLMSMVPAAWWFGGSEGLMGILLLLSLACRAAWWFGGSEGLMGILLLLSLACRAEQRSPDRHGGGI